MKRAAERRRRRNGNDVIYFMLNFLYRAKFDNGLIENELDHVYIGFSDEKLNLIRLKLRF